MTLIPFDRICAVIPSGESNLLAGVSLHKPMHLLAVAALIVALGGSFGAAPVGAATRYATCKALNARYPHGVGLPGARDRTSGAPVTTFTRNRAVYLANIGRDRDKDKIACEKH